MSRGSTAVSTADVERAAELDARQRLVVEAAVDEFASHRDGARNHVSVSSRAPFTRLFSDGILRARGQERSRRVAVVVAGVAGMFLTPARDFARQECDRARFWRR